MSEILYHGSEYMIDKPVYGLGKLHNDYGMGFYMTKDIDMSREWAVDYERNGYSNQYLLDTDGLRLLDLEQPPYTALHWLEILISNRSFEIRSPIAMEASRYLHENYHVDLGQFDMICGYRADDSYFTFANDFLNNTISYGQLRQAMRPGRLGIQLVLKSPKAFEQLTFIKGEPVFASEWYARRMDRDRQARKDYYAMNKYAYRKGDLYMTRILDEEVKPDDARLR